jgi:hypothetical protein
MWGKKICVGGKQDKKFVLNSLSCFLSVISSGKEAIGSDFLVLLS